MGNPTKHSRVDIDKLKECLLDLQDFQESLTNGRPGSWDAIGNELKSDLQQGDNGIQGDGPQVASDHYADNVFYMTRAYNDVKTGVGMLVTMLQTTITTHSGADQHAASAATQTNTGPSGPAGDS